MDVENCITGRRSVRKFKRGNVSDELVRRGIELAESAPDAGNVQEREYVIVRDPEVKKALSAASLGQPQPQTADVVVVFCSSEERISKYGKRGIELYAPQDVAAAVQNFLLFIHSQGLGAVWIGAFNEAMVSEALGLPRFIRPMVIVPVGLPGEVPNPVEKRPLAEKTHMEKWD
jgi:nitroreductase